MVSDLKKIYKKVDLFGRFCFEHINLVQFIQKFANGLSVDISPSELDETLPLSQQSHQQSLFRSDCFC